MQNIGFIGLGHMGAPMAINLIKAGHNVTAFDLSKEALAMVTKEGAAAASSLAELARQSDVVITMLQKGDQVRSVCYGAEGLFDNMKEGALYIDSSTIDVTAAKEVHECAKTAGFKMVDAPVSGGVPGAAAATLTFMVGGTDASFKAAKPILEAMGKNIIHAGHEGTGQAAKACNNMILAISMIAVSEGFTLAEKLGVDPKTFYDISSTASGQCWSMTSYCPVPNIVESAPSNNEYKPGFTASMMLKDLNLSQDAADSVSAATPLGKAATQLYSEFVGHGGGEIDFSGIIKMLEE
jgi:3-hydroxyisobutyrate dehydrogenase